METAAGRHRFDEMDGMIPFGAGVLGGLLLVGGVVAGLIAALKRRT